MNPQVEKEHYFRRKYDDLERFISYYYQVSLVQEIAECDSKNSNTLELSKNKDGLESFEWNSDVLNRKFKILEIGKGSGFFSDYMKKLGYNLTTCDFDKNLNPDVVADIRSLPFKESGFDVVTAFEVLEHIPFEEVSKALAELRRVTKRYALISLPYKSTGWEWVFKFPGVRTIFRKSFLDFFLRIPLKFGGIKVSGQHYWEIDYWNYRLGKVRRILGSHFRILREIKPVLNKYHYFFVLQK